MLPIAGKHASRNTMTIITYFRRPKRAWCSSGVMSGTAGKLLRREMKKRQIAASKR